MGLGVGSDGALGFPVSSLSLHLFAFLHCGTLPPAVLWLCDGVGETCLKEGLHRGIASPGACAGSWGEH